GAMLAAIGSCSKMRPPPFYTTTTSGPRASARSASPPARVVRVDDITRARSRLAPRRRCAFGNPKGRENRSATAARRSPRRPWRPRHASRAAASPPSSPPSRRMQPPRLASLPSCSGHGGCATLSRSFGAPRFGRRLVLELGQGLLGELLLHLRLEEHDLDGFR